MQKHRFGIDAGLTREAILASAAVRQGPGSGPLVNAGGASVELIGLSKSYGSVPAVRDISLSIAPGEFMTFLGPSGSGKTTVLSLLAGLTIPSAGDIRIGRKSVVSVAPHKRNVGLVFQNYALFPHLDVRANVSFPLEMRGLAKEDIRRRVASTLRLVRLSGLESRRPRQLSGGQQQRVALARALVFNPPVLLLDEPLGALDAKLREQMTIELKELHRSIGSTILFVTHDQEEALSLSDRIAIFRDGRIVQVGTPDELYRSPANRFVADFIGETNLLSGTVVALEGERLKVMLAGDQAMTGQLRPGFPIPKRHATFTLRLEHVTVGPAAESMPNKYRGHVEQLFYIGNSTKYRIRIGPDLVLSARQQTNGHCVPIPLRSEITIGWRESDLLLVDADQSADE
jgi:putative spermidine/putrescine transport system ATP-binding protein